MIKMTLQKLVDANGTGFLAKLLEKNPDMPVGLAWANRNLAGAILTHQTDFDTARLDLFKKYGDPTEDGKSIQLREDDKPKFLEEFKVLLNQEVELPGEAVKITEPFLDKLDFMHDSNILRALEPFLAE
jgi:hypothetical protein